MTENELLDLISYIQTIKCESQTIELKSAHYDCPKRLYDTLSSFSNQDSGGIILFGINEADDYSIVGVYDIQDLQKRVTEQCKQMVPVVRPVFTSVLTPQGAIVATEIPGIDISERPCYYGGVGRSKGSYIRSGDSDEPMSDYEIYSYEAFRKKYQDDVRVNERASMTAIDLPALEHYIADITENNPKLAKLSDTDIKRFLNMVIDGKPSLACTLLFSIYPQMFYPQYTINATVIPGYERGDAASDGTRFTDNLRIEGTLDQMLNASLKFLRKNMKLRTVIDPATGQRNDKTEYPMIALREALMNAMIHRDYSIHTEAMPIELTMYKDRLEIRNPGGLYGRLTLDTLGKVQPDTRNPVLARALETLGLTENRYSGIPTIQRVLREANMKEAVFSDSRNEFVVTFFNGETAISSGSTPALISETDRLLTFCKEPRSRKEIADFLGITTIYHVTQHYIKPLLDEDRLFMTKPDTPKSKHQKFYSK